MNADKRLAIIYLFASRLNKYKHKDIWIYGFEDDSVGTFIKCEGHSGDKVSIYDVNRKSYICGDMSRGIYDYYTRNYLSFYKISEDNFELYDYEVNKYIFGGVKNDIIYLFDSNKYYMYKVIVGKYENKEKKN